MVCFSCHFLQFAWWNVWSVCLNVFWWISICRAWLSETHFAFCSLCPSNRRALLYSLNVLCCFLFRADYCWHWWQSKVSNRLFSPFVLSDDCLLQFECFPTLQLLSSSKHAEFLFRIAHGRDVLGLAARQCAQLPAVLHAITETLEACDSALIKIRIWLSFTSQWIQQLDETIFQMMLSLTWLQYSDGMRLVYPFSHFLFSQGWDLQYAFQTIIDVEATGDETLFMKGTENILILFCFSARY